MTIEYVLLLTVVFMLSLKGFMGAPRDAFMNAGPKLGARIERHLITGQAFSENHRVAWKAE